MANHQRENKKNTRTQNRNSQARRRPERDQRAKEKERVQVKPEVTEKVGVAKGSCPAANRCGGCKYQGMDYADQLQKKQSQVETLLGSFVKPLPILGMEEPKYYRNKVHHVLGRDRKGEILSGFYEPNSHRIVGVKECMLEDKKSQEIIGTINSMLKSFKIQVYDERSHSGLLRHILVRRGFETGEIMVVLILTSPIFPGKKNFVKALRDKHPEITTIVLNVNERDTTMVLGERNIVLYGPGYIKDKLCGCMFRISPTSFYQINPVQTEKLYNTAIEYAGLTGKETVIDAYCGIGTIGLTAAAFACKVIGVELNKEAVRDARINCRENGFKNAEFYQGDAGDFMVHMANNGDKADVVFMDPPRSGSTEQFVNAVAKLGPEKVVYVSCNPETQARDLKWFKNRGYKVVKAQPVDMFPYTEHVETVVLLSRS